MPFKNHEDAADWNRRYQQRRSNQMRVARATIEGKLISLVQKQPAKHDILSLYFQLRPEGWPVKMVERAVQDLLKARVLHWDGRSIPSRLVLNDIVTNPFAALPHAPAGDTES